MVWDFWIRFGHWAVVALIAFQFYSGEDVELRDLHAWAGVLLLAWVVFRVVWGFVGPTYARFSDFLASPKAVISSFKALLARQSESKVGHTYAGGLGVVGLMALIATLSVTGLFSTDDIFYDGPLNFLISSSLAGELTSIHHLAGNILIAVIAAHVSAIMWHQFVMRERLIQGMWHGAKRGGQETFGLRVWLVGGALLGLSVSAGVALMILTGG